MQSRQRVRERDLEREQRVQDYEWDEVRGRTMAWRKKLEAERPRVVKYDSVPWEQSRAAYHKVFTTYDLPTAERKSWISPLRTLRVMMQILDTGHKNANHRHYPEVPFYIVQGKGHEIHDGRRHDWETGDLMIVPPYCMHQHFCDEGPAILVYCQADHGAITLDEGNEQAERNENWVLPDDSRPLYDEKGALVGYRRGELEFFFDNDFGREKMKNRVFDEPPRPSHPATDNYEYYVRLFEEERYWRNRVPQVIKQSDREWEQTRNGKTLWYTHPSFESMDNGMRMFETYLMELPPGGRSGKHLHVGEEAHFIIEGNGHTVIDDVSWEWDTQDVVAVPALATHQSFNDDPDRPATFLVFKSRLYDYASYGGIEHLEDASG
jgi:gentisate 1,2-dioxygenase